MIHIGGRTARRYGGVAIVLHWLIAAAIAVQLMLAWRMTGARTPETFAVFQLHKSVGVTILALSLMRLAWRLLNPPPPLPAAMAGWERRLARLTHAGFYVVMIGMPLSGWLMVSTSPLRLPTLLYGWAPWPDLPGFAGLARPAREAWRVAGAYSHASLAILFGLLFVLHVAAALKHQLARSDVPVLARMAPGAGRSARPWLVIAVGLAAALCLGLFVRPSPTPTLAAHSPAEPTTVAAAIAPPVPQTGEAPARWRILPGSALTFTTAWGGQPIQGRFDRWRADIRFSPQSLARSSITAVIDLASVSTGDPQRDAVLPGPDWLDAKAHPQAVFTATGFTPTGQDRYLARGRLELRGASSPVDLAFQIRAAGRKAQATGSARLDRTVLGVGQGEWRRTDQIPAAVEVGVALRAERGG